MNKKRSHLAVQQLEPRVVLSADLGVRVDLVRVEQGGEFELSVVVSNSGPDAVEEATVESNRIPIELQTTWLRGQPFSSSVYYDELNGVDGVVIYDHGLASVSKAGDVNGDGRDDLVVATNDFLSPSSLQGRAFVLWGGPALVDGIDLDDLDPSEGFEFVSSQGVGLGKQVSTAGDINADGFDDLLIGARRVTSPAGPSGVYIVFGSPEIGSQGSFNLDSLNGDNGFTFSGRLAVSGGMGLDSVGDVDDDGIDDVVLGISPSVYVLFGGEDIGYGGHLNYTELGKSSGIVIGDGGRDVEFGHQVSGVGDVNGDGVDDFLIGTRSVGEAYVIFGADDIGDLGATSILDALIWQGITVTQSDIIQTVSGDVSGAGDFNGDGIDDFVVGDPGHENSVHIVFGASDIENNAFLDIPGLDRTTGQTFSTPGFSIGIEESLSEAGDINADGFDDIIIGTPEFGDGGALVVFGGPGPFERDLFANADKNGGFRIRPRTNLSTEREVEPKVGSTLDLAGDLNGDGIDDVVVGADGSVWGTTFVLFGKESVRGSGPIEELMTLETGETAAYTITGTIPADADPFTFTVSVSPTEDDPDPSNNSVSVLIDSSLDGDINLDGSVNFSDFLILSANYGRDFEAKRSDGDLTGDEVVDFADFLILSADYGNGLEPAAVDMAFATS